jgi:membrane-associated phospholipid phosphatase
MIPMSTPYYYRTTVAATSRTGRSSDESPMATSDAPPNDLLVAVAAGVAFVALARIVCRTRPTGVDRAAHDLAEQRGSRLLERVMRPIEVAGVPAVYIPAAALTARWLRRQGRGGGRTIVSAAASGWIAMRLARLRYARRRPPRPRHRGPKAELSFPSGHTTGLTALAVAAGTVLAREHATDRRTARAIAVGLPLIVGFNRVYVREHWLTDVIGGWMLGAAVAYSCLGLHRVNGRARWPSHPAPRRS